MPTPVITPTEYVILFIARNIVACTLRLNPGVGPPTLQDSGGPGPAELFSDHFALQAYLLQRRTQCQGGLHGGAHRGVYEGASKAVAQVGSSN